MNRREALASMGAALAAAGVVEPMKAIAKDPVGYLIQTSKDCCDLDDATLRRLYEQWQALWIGTGIENPPKLVVLPPGWAMTAISELEVERLKSEAASIKHGAVSVKDLRQSR